eukprot:g19262.t1
MVSSVDTRPKNIDSLLRFFQSDYFRSEIFYLMHYLYHDERPGIQDYLVNQLYEKSDMEIDFYLCQLVQICVARLSDPKLHGARQSLSKFLIWKAKQSVHFALKIHWLAISVFEEAAQTKALKIAGDTLIDQVEHAVVNAHLHMQLEDEVGVPPPSTSGLLKKKTLSDPKPDSILTYLRSMKRDARASFFELEEGAPNVYSPEELGDSIPRIEEEKKIQTVNYWNTQLAFSTFLLSLSSHVMRNDDRDSALQKPLSLLNTWLFERRCFGACALSQFEMIGLHVPLHGWDTRLQLLKVHTQDCRVFSTKTRAPFLLTCEFGDLDELGVVEAVDLEGPSAPMVFSGRDLVYREVCGVLGEELPEGADCNAAENATNALDQLLQRVALTDWVKKVYQQPIEEWGDDVDYVSDAEKDEFWSEDFFPTDEIFDEDLDPVEVLKDQEKVREREKELLLKSRSMGSSVSLGSVPSRAASVAGAVPASDGGISSTGGAKASSSLPGRPESTSAGAAGEVAATASTGSAGGAAAIISGAKKSASFVQIDDTYVDEKITSSEAVAKADEDDRIFQRKKQAGDMRKQIWGEPWQNKKRRIEKTSAYSRLKSWCLRSIIVKSGDDVRQEVLASQLIAQFKWIFDQAPGLSLHLRPIEVLITGARSGFIEMVPDSISIDRLKRKFPDKSMSEVFNHCFADRLLTAKKNFIESTAAYSLVCYFLQVRDRHNGNMLLDRNGCIIHIDFGFMLSNSPGNVAFETSPFKMTQEFLDIMDGDQSEQYQYFCTLLIRGFLEARRHIERISTIIQMQMMNSNLPCFSQKSCTQIITELEERFFRGVPDDSCIEQIHQLIDSSVNNWRTRQYDNYQRITNGIL